MQYLSKMNQKRADVDIRRHKDGQKMTRRRPNPATIIIVIQLNIPSRRRSNYRSSGRNFRLRLFSSGRDGSGSSLRGVPRGGSGVFQGGNRGRLIDLRGVLIHLSRSGRLDFPGLEQLANARRQPASNLHSGLPNVFPLSLLLLLLRGCELQNCTI